MRQAVVLLLVGRNEAEPTSFTLEESAFLEEEMWFDYRPGIAVRIGTGIAAIPPGPPVV
jgi:hypothetical protein